MHGFAWASLGFLVVFVALVAIAAWHNRRRRQGWSRVADQFNLSYEQGDPLGLSSRLGAEVSETVWGRFEGADLAVVTATRLLSDLENPDRALTSSVGVSLRIGVTRGLEVANEAAGPRMTAGVTPDGLLVVWPSGRKHRRLHHPISAQDLPRLLGATSRATRSQYW